MEAFELRVLRKLRSDDGNYLQEKPESDHHEEDVLRRNCLQRQILEGAIAGARGRSRPRNLVTPCKEGDED